MGSDFDNLLPPWLRGADEPEGGDEKATPPTSDSAPEPPAPGLPPWLAGLEIDPASMVKATGELSEDYLASADSLPESTSADITYDEWIRIQSEAKRPRSVEEETPDLLGGVQAAVPFPEGSVQPPKTGELPDWFLGLEELDESQAPAWFSDAPTRAITDEHGAVPWLDPNEPEATAPPPTETAPDLDDLFGLLDSFESEQPDLLADAAPTDKIPEALDDFFAAIGSQREANADDTPPLDLAMPLPDELPEDEDFFSDFAAPLSTAEHRAAELMSAPLADADDEPFDFSFDDDDDLPAEALPGDEFNFSEPTLASRPMMEFDEPDLDLFSEPTIASRNLIARDPSFGLFDDDEDAPTADPLDAESQSWLNEINAIVGSAIRDDTGEFYSADDIDDFVADVAANTFDEPPSPEPTTPSSSTPDWLSQLQAMPDRTAEFEQIDQPAHRPTIDFSDMSFDSPAVRTDENAQYPSDDPIAGLFDDLAPMPPPPPANRGARRAGDTIILPDDGQAASDGEELEPVSGLSPEDIAMLASLRTDEIEQVLFPDNTPHDARRSVTDAAADIGELEDYFGIEALAEQAAPTPPAEPAPAAEEDLTWLHDVEFDFSASAQDTAEPLAFDFETDDQTENDPAPAASAAPAPAPPPAPPTPPPAQRARPVQAAPAQPPPSPPPADETDPLAALFAQMTGQHIDAVNEPPPAPAAARAPSPPVPLAPVVDSELPGETPIEAADALWASLTGELQVPAPAVDISTDKLRGLFGEVDDAPASDTLVDLLETAADSADAEQAFDAMFNDLDLDADDPAPASRIMATTSELDDLFGEFDKPDDSIADDHDPMTGWPAPSVQPEARPPESVMPDKDEFDDLFGDLDDLPEGEGSAEVSKARPGFAVSDDDLDALFAAFDAEMREPSSGDELPSTGMLAGDDSNLPPYPWAQAESDDDFFAQLGLGDAEPPKPKPPAAPPGSGEDDITGPDLDFLQGFRQPEMSETTVISGEEHTSVWEAQETTGDTAQSAIPSAPAFSFENEPGTGNFSADIWDSQPAVDDFAPIGDAADAARTPQPIARPAPVPEWLEAFNSDSFDALPADDVPETDDMAWTSAPGAAEAPAASDMPLDIDQFIANLEATETVLPQSLEFTRPMTSTDEIDIDSLFEAALPDTSGEPAIDTPSGLERDTMLSELKASVDEISAAALARQMKDRPEEELPDRLKRLRQRTTDEMPAAPSPEKGRKQSSRETPPAPTPDIVSNILQGVDDALAPAPSTPIVTDPAALGGIRLTDQQQGYVKLLRDLIGIDETQVETDAKMSAIEMTYAAPHLRTDETLEEIQVGATAAQATSARKKRRAARTYRIDRLIFSLLLAAGILIPFFVSEMRIGALPPAQFSIGSSENRAFQRIDRLEAFDLVLVGLEYSPAAAGELDSMTEALVRHMLLRGARPIFISGNPYGVVRAESIIARINADTDFLESINLDRPLAANIEYFASRFLPGSAIGLRAFSESTAALLQVDINGQTTGLNLESLSNLALITLITDRAEDVRSYAEQIAPLAGRPLVAAVNYAAAPLAQPYSVGGSPVTGLLVGYEDAYTYSGLLDTVEAVERGPRPVLPVIETPAPDTASPAASESGATTTPEPGATLTPESSNVLRGRIVSSSGANLRSGPGTDFNVVRGMARNLEVTVIGYNSDGNWVNVRLDDGTEGWVSSGLIVVVEATPTPASGASSGTGSVFLRPLAQRNSAADADTPEALRWYAMNMGILVSAAIIIVGSVMGILRGIFGRRSRS